MRGYLVRAGGITHDIELTDLNYGGCGIITQIELETGESVKVSVLGRGSIDAQVRWYRDGILYHTARPDTVKGDWVFEHPFFVILNVAVGGNWPGPPDGSTQFPQTMVVDHVRVYAR